MCDPSHKKSGKISQDKSQLREKQRILVQGLMSTATSYVSQFVTYVKGLQSKTQVTGDSLKGLVCKAERKVKEIHEKILNEVKVFQENELKSCKHYSKEELAKVGTKFIEYSAKIQVILEDLMKRLQVLKNELQTKIMTHKEIHSLFTYLDEKINQAEKLTQDMIKNIQETIKDAEFKRKLHAIIKTNYTKIKNTVEALQTAVKDDSAIGKDNCIKSGSNNGKSLKSVTKSYILRFVAYVRGLVPGKISVGQTETPISEDIKDILAVTEVKVKGLYDGILKKVKDLHDNELETYKIYSKEELAKVKSNLREYSAKLRELSENTLQRLKDLKNELQTKIITHEDFQIFLSFFETKIVETKKLTEDVIKNIRATIKEPALGKTLETIVEINSQKLKIALNDLCTAIKKNVAKVGQLKSFSDNKRLFPKIPTFGKFKTSIDCSSASTVSNKDNEAADTHRKGHSAIGLNREKLPFLNLSKHFNSRTLYGRANASSKGNICWDTNLLHIQKSEKQHDLVVDLEGMKRNYSPIIRGSASSDEIQLES